MKAINFLFVLTILFLSSCKDSDSNRGKISGSQSEMGKVGTTYNVSVTGVTGVSNFQVAVQSSSDNVSSVDASCKLTNTKLLQILQNFPGDFTVKGDNVSIKGLQVKNLTDGIEKLSGMNPGVVVNYGSAKGDTYPMDGSKNVRTVSLVNTENSYNWSGMNIKTIEVTEPVNSKGIVDIIYIANHKWGLVGIRVIFDDKSTIVFPVESSKHN